MSNLYLAKTHVIVAHLRLMWFDTSMFRPSYITQKKVLTNLNRYLFIDLIDGDVNMAFVAA